MAMEIKTIPEIKEINVSKSGDLPAGKTIKITIDDVVYENLEYKVPAGKKLCLRIDIRGRLIDV